MGYTVIAPVSTHTDAIYVGIKEFSTDKIVLLTPPHTESLAENIKKDLSKFKIEITILKLKEPLWEELFQLVGRIVAAEKNEVIVNVGSGDHSMKCASVCAAFVNGLKAFDIVGNSSMLLPVLKFSYYKLLTDRKLHILKVLHTQKDCCGSLEDLAKKTNMSLPLISYHINGTLKSEGLKQLGLVEITRKKRKTAINLTTLGRLLITGYIKP